ncbi:dihydroneopterin aldolase [Litoreibacter roseus]|uniref:Diguanylate cyclase n=1 Tax=Litoreibacter roseus TaxID=2601869 RepID=A0A6N6JI65_9RHOB|nr:dihydroneopterin aldolase [Litoreibacter roseus]GFE65956.1 diguanylate cyclase [Litoreibacter roseus]
MSSDIRLAFAHPSERAQATSGPELRDRISLRDHIREVDIGAFQSERGQTQRICFNVVVEVHPSTSDGFSALDDDVDKILSYDTITEAIDRELSEERLNLLETLAERVAEAILGERMAARVFVRIEKLDRGPGALGVEIVRDKAQIAPTVVEDVVQPLVIYMDDTAISRSDVSDLLDRLEAAKAPLILCVGPSPLDLPQAAHPAAQRRIDLLALEQNAWVLAGRDKRCVVVATRTELDWAMKNGQISVWAPSKIVLDATEGPEVSHMDGPALAHWFAGLFHAKALLAVGSPADWAGPQVTADDLLAGSALPV